MSLMHEGENVECINENLKMKKNEKLKKLIQYNTNKNAKISFSHKRKSKP